MGRQTLIHITKPRDVSAMGRCTQGALGQAGPPVLGSGEGQERSWKANEVCTGAVALGLAPAEFKSQPAGAGQLF